MVPHSYPKRPKNLPSPPSKEERETIQARITKRKEKNYQKIREVMELNAAEYEIFKKIKEDHRPSLEQKSSDSTMNALSEKYFPLKIKFLDWN